MGVLTNKKIMIYSVAAIGIFTCILFYGANDLSSRYGIFMKMSRNMQPFRSSFTMLSSFKFSTCSRTEVDVTSSRKGATHNDWRHIGNSHTSMSKDEGGISPKHDISERKMVIILAYMHTGSSFLGSIFQNHEHTFYEYENLRSLMYSTRAGKTIYFLNGTEKLLLPNPDKKNVHHNVDPKVGAEAVKRMITCRHGELDIATLTNHYFDINESLNRDLRSFFRCQEKRFGKSTRVVASGALTYVENPMLKDISLAADIVKKCLTLLIEKCRHSKMVVEKYIRMTMEMTEILLEQIKNLKIIHLVRDPRAMLDSQVRRGNDRARSLDVFNQRAQYMCKQMTKDLQLSKKLLERFPGQIYSVRFEDMVSCPIESIRKIFNFTETGFTKYDENFLKRHSRPRKHRRRSQLLGHWRRHIKPNYLKLVDKHCKELYRKLGYVELTYEDIKNPTMKTYL